MITSHDIIEWLRGLEQRYGSPFFAEYVEIAVDRGSRREVIRIEGRKERIVHG